MKILLTGASGSFGTAFLAHIFREGLAEKVVAFARGEHRLAELAERLGHPAGLHLMVGDVRDPGRIEDAMSRVDTVIHAAALKRVDAVNSPEEIYKTNVTGTINVIRSAVRRNVPRVLVISSDKACEPSTAYGASKLAAELYAVWANTIGQPQCRVSVVRWGNVLGSQGSVIHAWRRQAARGGPITLTDPEMVRFWLTMPTAVAFALWALRSMQGGEVFVPRLTSMTLADLAEAFAPRYLKTITGIRVAGEKRAEVLVSEDEARRTALAPGGYIINPVRPSWPYTPRPGVPLKEAYRSDTNPDRVSIEAMRGWLAGVPEERA